LLLPFHVVIK